MYITMYTKLIFLVIACIIAKSEGQLRCYACGFSAVDTDHSCLTITNTTNRVECTMKYCTIMRQEYRDPVNEVASFTRGCEDRPDFLNHQMEDTQFRTYYRACSQNLCNIGDGIQSVVGGNLAPRPPFNGSNLFVPGTGSAGKNRINFVVLIIASCTFYFWL